MKRITIYTLILLTITVSLAAMENRETFVSEGSIECFDNPYLEMFLCDFDNDIDSHHIDRAVLFAENSHDIDMDEVNRKINEAMQKVEEATGRIPGNSTISIHFDYSRDDRPFMGIVSENITLDKAKDLGYEKFYGVLITRVVPDSPARAHRLLPDDIIMEINGNQITNERILTNVIKSYNVGDNVELKIFRNRNEIMIPFTFGTRDGTARVGDEPSVTRKPKIDLGSGGIGWIPVWYMPDLDDINTLVRDLGFSELDDSGQFLNGIGLKGDIGNGLFLGGMIVGYTLERKRGHEITDDDGVIENVIRRMKYNVRYGGITLEQRVGITRKMISSFGGMLGWGRTSVEVSQNKGDHQWNMIPEILDESRNNYLNLSKSHIFIQPKVELLYRLNSWLSIRGEVGYIYSYSYHSGWKAEDAGDVYEVTGSPNTSFDGVTVSIGPWFGF